MKLKNRHSKDGVVLVTVAIMTMVMMMLAVSLMSISSSQALSNRHQIDRIKAEQFAKGAFWNTYMQKITGNSVSNPMNEILDNRTYSANVTEGAAGSGLYGSTASYTITVSY